MSPGMKVIVIGCGRVGSNVAKALHRHGWDVTVVDEKEEALSRLGEDWPGRFIKGHGMYVGVLREAGIDGDEPPEAVVDATDGHNTNINIGQVAQKRFDIPTVVVRLLDPARSEFYAARGLRVVCPTSNAISVLTEAVRSAETRPREKVTV
jgi:trk system potassium uptake protein TrkA